MNTDTATELFILGTALTIFIGVVICVTRRNINNHRCIKENKENQQLLV